MNKLHLLNIVVVSLALSLLSGNAVAQDYVFKIIANEFGPIKWFSSASINNSGTVAFDASLDDGSDAVYTSNGGAFTTIADANITTLIAAVVLFSMGTGPIKGFAITLCIGILTSMFTAIFGTRVLVNKLYGGKRLSSLPI